MPICLEITMYRYDSSDDDDDLSIDHKRGVLRRVFKEYGETLKSQSKNDNAADKYVQERLGRCTQTCLICISSVKREHQIWTCCNCFDTFHLPCIQQWIKEGIVDKGVLSDEMFPHRQLPWNCPKCRFSFDRKNFPHKYWCFCGQQENPPFDPWMTPHSCGQKCGRMLRPKCGHQCMLLCHPGPCPPCPKMVMTSCFCGQSKNVAKRCGSMKWSCGKTCARTLLCAKHECKDVCHEGQCPPCPHFSRQPCRCGRQIEVQPCGTKEWQCENECGKALPCDLHRCSKKCHKGECGECPKSGARTCPCGKSKEVILPCSIDVPTCEDTCGKSLGCSNGHKCSRRCHYDDCGQCLDLVLKTCRCGKKAKKIACSRTYACNIKCQKLRDCSIHQCRRMCCDGNCPACEHICSKTLQCKRHKCQLMCHQGRCFPCNLQSTLSCNCGSTTMLVMCGKEKTSKPPRCNKLCTTPSSCHHTKRQPHNCHFGTCPPCTQICCMPLDCLHKCKEKCHDEVLVESKVKAAGPWELALKPSFVTAKLPCPPCQEKISVNCYGLHDNSAMPCCEAKPYCCGRSCGQPLNCGFHFCEMQCHVTKQSEHSGQVSTMCQDCERPCSKPRPDGCPHECSSTCHSGPCRRCKRALRIRCHCNMTELKFLCCDFTSADEDSKVKLMSCGNECQNKLPCGHPCGKPCHVGPCLESCNRRVVMKCPCNRRKKELTCPQARDGYSIMCDEICTEKRLHKEEEAKKNLQKRKVEKHLEADKELLRFERSLAKSSKSRRKRVVKDQVSESEGWLAKAKRWKRTFTLLTFLSVIPIAIAFVWYSTV